MTPNVVCIIQARMGSQRFPGKVIESLSGWVGGPDVLTFVVRRALESGHDTIVAVPGTAENMRIAPHAVPVFRYQGEENDVLGRYAACARYHKADVVVRITGDCPLVDPVAIQGQVKRLLDTGAMYVSNIYPVRTVPSGFDVEVFTATALYVADALATEPYDREHVTPWIQKRFAREEQCQGCYTDRPHLSFDTPEDLALIRRVAEKMP
jgi:spore coat polysaccharide biosynthesis protein SpsF (cytidylyltransferase family)